MPTYFKSFTLVLIFLSITASVLEPRKVQAQEPFEYAEFLRIGRGTITDIDWSPDGEYLAASGSLGIWIYTPNLEDVILLEQNIGVINSIDWDDNQIISGSSNGYLYLWNADNWELQKTFEHKDFNIQSVDSNGQQFVTLSTNISAQNFVEIWSKETGNIVSQLETASYTVKSLSWSNDGKYIAGTTYSNAILVWSAEQDWSLTIIDESEINGESLAWHSNSHYLIATSSSGYVIQWNVNTNQFVSAIPASNANHLAWNSEQNLVAISQQPSHDLSILDTQLEETLTTFKGHTQPVFSIGWSPNGKYLASVSRTGELFVWNIALKKLNASNLLYLPRINAVVWSPNGNYLASLAAWGQPVEIWDATTGELIYELPHQSDQITALTWHPNSQQLAIAAINEIQIWDVITQDAQYVPVDNMGGSLNWSVDSTRLITSIGTYEAREIVILDSASGETVSSFQSDTNTAQAVQQSHAGEMIASISENADTLIWDINTSQILYSLSSDNRRGIIGDIPAHNVTWSPNDKFLAVLTYDDNYETSIWVWDVSLEQHIATLSNQDDFILATAWSPDGKNLAAATRQGQVHIWDMSTYQPIGVIQGHTDQVTSISWKPDGTQIATASADGTIRTWAISH